MRHRRPGGCDPLERLTGRRLGLEVVSRGPSLKHFGEVFERTISFDTAREIAKAGRKGPDGPRPPWLRSASQATRTSRRSAHFIGDLSLHTVCQEGRCPNIFECWSERTATLC